MNKFGVAAVVLLGLSTVIDFISKVLVMNAREQRIAMYGVFCGAAVVTTIWCLAEASKKREADKATQ